LKGTTADAAITIGNESKLSISKSVTSSDTKTKNNDSSEENKKEES